MTVLVAAGLGTAAASAADVTWTGLGDGASWSDGMNWDTGVSPCGPSDRVFIDGDPLVDAFVFLNVFCSTGDLSIGLGDTLVFNNGVDLAMEGDAIVNEGRIVLNASSQPTDLVLGTFIGDELITLSGGGVVQFADSGNGRIFGAANDNRLLNVDNLIRGSGSLGADSMRLTNQGTVRADGVDALVVDPRDGIGGVVNGGLLEACDGGRLVLQDGVFENLGAIRAITTGTVDFATGAVLDHAGDPILAGDASVVRLRGATLRDVAFVTEGSGIVEMPNNTSNTIEGTLGLDGLLAMGSTGNNTDLRISGDVLIDGSGTILLSDVFFNRIFGDDTGTEVLTIEDGAMIRGAGQVGVNALGIVNRGAIVADAVSFLRIDPGAAGMVNEGELVATGGGTLQLGDGTFDNAGGVLRAEDGSVIRPLSGCAIEQPRVELAGTGRLLHANNVSVSIAGDLDIDGPWEMDSTGNNTDLRICGDPSLPAGASIAMSDSFFNRIFGDDTGTEVLTIEDGAVIRGAGQVGVNALGIVNRGSIVADAVSFLRIDPGAAGMVNEGELVATGGGTLQLGDGTFDTAGGVLRAEDDSEIRPLNGALIDHPAFELVGSGRVVHANDVSVTIAGDLDINGPYEMESTGNNTDLRICGDPSLPAGASIAMSDSFFNRIFGDDTGTEVLTIEQGAVIRGAGQVGVNALGIVNRGSIVADGVSFLAIDPGAGGAVNQGEIRATDGATLRLGDGLHDHAGGTLTIEGASAVQVFIGAHLHAPTIETTGSGRVFQSNGGTATISGAVTIDGPWEIRSTGNATDLRIAGDVVLSGGGSIAPTDNFFNRVFGAESGLETLTIADDFTFAGPGQLGVNFMNLVNEGSILAGTDFNRLDIDPADNGSGFLNAGLLEVQAGPGCRILAGPFVTTGEIRVAGGRVLTRTSGNVVQDGGRTLADGAVEVDAGAYELFGGLLEGQGFIDATSLVNHGGVLRPGAEGGSMTVTGDFEQEGGELDIRLSESGGTLLVLGDATLGGALRLSRTDGFVPAVGVPYEILGAASIAGIFEFIESCDPIEIQYGEASVSVVFGEVSGVAGDLTGDGAVDAQDLLILLAAFGDCDVACCPADLDGDGIVGVTDLLDLLANWS